MVWSPAHHFQKKQESPPADGKGSLISQKDASVEWAGSHHFIWVEADAEASVCPLEETIQTRDKIWPPPALLMSPPTCYLAALSRPSHTGLRCWLLASFLCLGFSFCSSFPGRPPPHHYTPHTLPGDHSPDPLEGPPPHHYSLPHFSALFPL